MKVLVACEFSGRVRDAFIKKGHDTISCDLLPTESPGPHYQGSVFDIINDGFDLIIAHPPCTFLCNSGVRWLKDIKNKPWQPYTNQKRWDNMVRAGRFFRSLLESNISKICIENPIPHKYAVKEIGQKYNQIIQPWQFGHGETKATCLWLKGLPLLKPTKIVKGREAKIHKMPPSENRAKLRSITYRGIADAMADQWG